MILSRLTKMGCLQSFIIVIAISCCRIDVVTSFIPTTKTSTRRTNVLHYVSHRQYTRQQQYLSNEPPRSFSFDQRITRRRRRHHRSVDVAQQKNEFAETSSTTNAPLGDLNVSDSTVQLFNLGSASSTTGTVSTAALDQNDHLYEIAIRRTIAWVSAAILFGTGLGLVAGRETSEEFFAGYLLEQSLSIDNLLVFLLLFEYFKIPVNNQNRVLNWGIIGAIIMRAVMIGAGAIAIQQFRAVLLVFAAVLIVSSAKVIFGSDDDDTDDLSQNQIVKFSNNIINSTDRFDGDRFFTEIDGIRKATPMLLCMIAVEVSDVVFAVDSIPAVFGVTENPLVVFSSNMFAIMGLRSLYTILSKAASELEYLDKAVAVVLGFIGGKMIFEFFGFELPTEVSVGVVITVLGSGVLASVLEADKDKVSPDEESSES